MTRGPVAESPVRVGGLWLVPVFVTTEHRSPRGLGRWVHVTKTPEAIVVVGPDGARAFAMDGSERAMAEVLDDVEGLRAVMSSLDRAAVDGLQSEDVKSGPIGAGAGDPRA